MGITAVAATFSLHSKNSCLSFHQKDSDSVLGR